MKIILSGFLILWCAARIFPAIAVSKGDTTTVNISGTIIENTLCTINSGNAIQVFLGNDIFIDKIDGESYKKTAIPINLDCTKATEGIHQSLVFKASGIGVGCDKYLCTDHDGLMLKLYRDTKNLDVGEEVSYVSMADGTALGLGGGLDFYVVPLKKNNANPKSGLFLSAATIVVDVK